MRGVIAWRLRGAWRSGARWLSLLTRVHHLFEPCALVTYELGGCGIWGAGGGARAASAWLCDVAEDGDERIGYRFVGPEIGS